MQRREIPQDVPEMERGACKRVTEVLVKAGFAESRRAAERLIAGNAVKVDGEAVTDANAPWVATEPAVVAVGRAVSCAYCRAKGAVD